LFVLRFVQDVKEMVPELFYDASFLENWNGFRFGEKQSGAAVDGVLLPPWARDAVHFVALHRAALESEHVSARLHLWIDLVFGAAQKGPRAEESLNVFFWTTYPDALDWKRLQVKEKKENTFCVVHKTFKHETGGRGVSQRFDCSD
jgi:hypothetical protein